MRRLTIMICCFLLLVMVGCKQKSNSGVSAKQQEAATTLTDQYHHADSLYKIGFIDSSAFNAFIASAIEFAEQNPKADIAPEMLYKAGIGSMILAKSSMTREDIAKYAKQALKIFYDFQEKYPEHENAKYCYYQRGIIYDDILGDYTSAEDQYRDFINRNPDDSLTIQLKDYLKVLGKSESQVEEMLNLN